MLKIGLTGGIGSGKSSAADRFSQLGVPIIDADVIAREVVKPGQPALEEIVSTFGDQVLGNDGTLDRARLRDIVFTAPQNRARLESIMHPRIHAQILAQIEQLSAPYCIVVIPLLAESKRNYPLDRVLVIDIPEALQLERTATRDRQPTSKINAIIQSQASREQRLNLADDIVENSGSLDELYLQIDKLHKMYVQLTNLTKSNT